MLKDYSCIIITVLIIAIIPVISNNNNCYGYEVKMEPAGDAGDNDPTTFKFNKDNIDIPLTKADGTPIKPEEVSQVYGTPDGMRIYCDGVDILSAEYRGHTGPEAQKKILWIDMSDDNWTEVKVPPCTIAIDPRFGRFKFSKGNNKPIRLVNSIHEPLYAYDICISGNYLYVVGEGGWSSRMVVMDISNPQKPVPIGSVTTYGRAVGVYVVNNLAYVIDQAYKTQEDYNGGLYVIDISNPMQGLAVLGRYENTGGRYEDIYVADGYAYITDKKNGLQIIDVSTPSKPVLSGEYNTQYGGRSVYVSGKYAYITNGSIGGRDGFQIIDVSEPTNPVLIGKCHTEGRATDVWICKNYAYVICNIERGSGVRVIDIRDKTRPRVVSKYTTGGEPSGMYMLEDYLYITQETICVVDVSNINNIKTVRSGDVMGYAYKIYIAGEYGYIADKGFGVRVIEIPTPSEAPTGSITVDYIYYDTEVDVYPPEIVDVTPVNRAKEVDVSEDIIINFSESMDQDSVCEAFEITPEVNIKKYIWMNKSKTLLIDIDVLQSKTKYTCTITTRAKDASYIGNRLTKPYTWSFVTSASPLTVELTLNKDTYITGEIVYGTISVTNNSYETISIAFPSTQLGDFRVISNTGDEIFKFSYNRRILHKPTRIRLSPGESQVLLNIAWQQVDNDGKQIPPGEYYIDAEMVQSILLPAKHAKMKTITIKPAPQITVTPAEGTTGTKVDITGRYFNPNNELIIINYNEDNQEIISYVTSDDNGIFSISLTIEVESTGSTPIKVKDSISDKVITTEYFTVIPEPGNIKVVSYPPEAQVYINNELKGTTNCVISDIPVGGYHITIVKPNYHTWTGSVTVISQETSVVLATLTPTTDTIISLDIPPVIGEGDIFDVNVNIENVYNLTNMDLFISFDPEFLEVIEITEGGFIPQIATHIGSDSVAYAAGVMTGSVTGTGCIAKLKIKAKATGKTLLKFDFNPQENRKTALISGTEEIPFVAESKEILIDELGSIEGHVFLDIIRVNSHAGIHIRIKDTELTTVTDKAGYFMIDHIPVGIYQVIAETYGASSQIWHNVKVVNNMMTTLPNITLLNGDFNGDGKVNAWDFSLFREAYFKTKEDKGWQDTGYFTRDGYINADFNGDDKVNTEDFAILRENYFKVVKHKHNVETKLAPGVEKEKKQKPAHLFIELPDTLDNIKVNQVFPVYIKVRNAVQLTNMDFFLRFDKNVLHAVRTQGSMFLPKIMSNIKNNKGYVSYGAGLMRGSANGCGTIATVFFKLKKRKPTKLWFIKDAEKNQQTMMMTIGRRIIPFTTESVVLFKDSDNIINGTIKSRDDKQRVYYRKKKDLNNIGYYSRDKLLSFVAKYKPRGMAYGILIRDNYAFMACEFAGLQILDISQPEKPKLISECDTLGFARNTYVKDKYAYVADGTAGLQVIDISDITKPKRISRCRLYSFTHDVCGRDNYLYVANAQRGMQIINIKNPRVPKRLGRYNTSGIARGVFVDNRYVYVADGSAGLKVIDVSNPYGPKQIGSCDTPGCAYDVYVVGDYAYIADYGAGLQIIDISKPAKPVIVGSYTNTGLAWDVIVENNIAYVAGEAGGLYVIDVRKPNKPYLLGEYNTKGKAFGVQKQSEYIFVADDYKGLKIIRLCMIPEDKKEYKQEREKPEVIISDDTSVSTITEYVDTEKKEKDVMILSDDGSSISTRILPEDITLPEIVNIDAHHGWRFGIIASVGDKYEAIIAGVHSNATDGFDMDFDYPLPPPLHGEYLQVYFIHPEWHDVKFEKFKQDIRKKFDIFSMLLHDSIEWEFVVETNIHDTDVKLSIINIPDKILDTYEVKLVDITRDKVWELRKSSSEIVFSSDKDITQYKFKLIIKLPVVTKKFTAGWNMFSIPVKPVYNTLDKLIGTSSGYYIYEYTRHSYWVPEKIVVGYGYWLGLLEDRTIKIRTKPYQETKGRVIIPLNSGWNMIGCPFTFVPDWSKVMIRKDGITKGLKDAVKQRWVLDVLYKYQDNTYKSADGIEPWCGYWFAALTECELIIPDIKKDRQMDNAVVNANNVSQLDMILHNNWRVLLHVTAGKYQDITNLAPCFGISPYASDALDEIDKPEPPEPQGEFVTLYFTHPEEEIFKKFDWDIKPYDKKGTITWRFEVKTNVYSDDNSIAISWDVHNLPPEYRFLLKDIDTQYNIDMHKCNVYTYQRQEDNSMFDVRRFEIVAIKKYSTNNVKGDNFENLKIYPNPTTSIPIKFRFSGVATIRIFTLSGELVKILTDVDGSIAEWDLTNMNNTYVASGIYLYVITNGDKKRTGKLAVIR